MPRWLPLSPSQVGCPPSPVANEGLSWNPKDVIVHVVTNEEKPRIIIIYILTDWDVSLDRTTVYHEYHMLCVGNNVYCILLSFLTGDGTKCPQFLTKSPNQHYRSQSSFVSWVQRSLPKKNEKNGSKQS